MENGPDRTLRRKVADCVRLLLAGKVSCDHILEEFGHSSDPPVREILELIEETAGSGGRYGKISREDQAARRKIEGLVARLLADESPIR